MTDDIHQIGLLIYTLLTDVNEDPGDDIEAILEKVNSLDHVSFHLK